MLDASHARAVAERFGVGPATRLVGPVAFGRIGEIWRLDTETGVYAVKQSRMALDAEDCERDAAYQDAVLAAGVPMPAVVRTVDGSVVGQVDDLTLRAYEWVDVAELDRRLDPVAVGRLLARIHLVHVPALCPVDSWYIDPVGADAWVAMVTRLVAAGAPFAERLADLVPSITEAEGLLSAPSRVQLCHCDLWADNVRRSARSLVVLDWEDSGPASPTHELAVVAYEYGASDPDRIRRLHAAYVEAGGPGRLREQGDFTMLVAQLGHIAQEGCRRWLASETDAERADNAAWVTEFLDEPPTVPVIESILAAATQ